MLTVSAALRVISTRLLPKMGFLRRAEEEIERSAALREIVQEDALDGVEELGGAFFVTFQRAGEGDECCERGLQFSRGHKPRMERRDSGSKLSTRRAICVSQQTLSEDEARRGGRMRRLPRRFSC